MLLEQSGDLRAMDGEMHRLLTPSVIDAALARVPDALLTDRVNGGEFTSGALARQRYREYLLARLNDSSAFVSTAMRAQEAVRLQPKSRVQARR